VPLARAVAATAAAAIDRAQPASATMRVPRS
jgi:hypothetical protein